MSHSDSSALFHTQPFLSSSVASDKQGVGYLVCSGVILMTASITTALLRGIAYSGDKMKSQGACGTVLIAIVRLAPREKC